LRKEENEKKARTFVQKLGTHLAFIQSSEVQIYLKDHTVKEYVLNFFDHHANLHENCISNICQHRHESEQSPERHQSPEWIHQVLEIKKEFVKKLSK
jgi:hypothetical protein